MAVVYQLAEEARARAVPAPVEPKAPKRRTLPPGIYKRGRIYWITYTRGGRQYDESTRRPGHAGTDLNEARRLLNERRGDIAKGVPVTPEASRFKFSDAAQLVIDNYILKERRSLSDMQRRLDKHLLPHFATLRMGEITTDVIDGFVVTRKKAGASNGEINRELAIIKRAFTLAARARKVHARPHIEMLPEAPPRSGFFEHADFGRVCKHLPQDVAALARFCYVTGWRWKSEARPLTWEQVDFASGTVTIDAGKTKGGEPRLFVMTPELRKLLKAQRAHTDRIEAEKERPCALVFHRRGKAINWFYTSWRNACKGAGVSGRILHDLRRTAIRNLVRAGVSEGVAMRMCGHRTRAVFDRYNVSSERDIRAAADLLSAHHKTLARQARMTNSLQSRRRTKARQTKSA